MALLRNQLKDASGDKKYSRGDEKRKFGTVIHSHHLKNEKKQRATPEENAKKSL